MNARTEMLLRPDEARQAIRHEKIDVSPSSPLGTFLNTEAPSTGGAAPPRPLDAGARAALRTLAAPTVHVRVVTPGAWQCRVAYFYGDADSGFDALVGCWAEDNALRISYPWSRRDLADAALDAMGGERSAPVEPFACALSPAGLFALAAATDALRAAEFSALLERRPSTGPRLLESDLQHQLAQGMADDDARWMVTLLRLLAPQGLSVGDAPLATGLGELKAAGLLAPDRGGWIASDALRRLAAFWATPLPAISHETGTQSEDGALIEHRGCIALGGAGPVWILDFEDLTTQEPRVALRAIAPADLPTRLASFLPAAPLAPHNARHAAAPAPTPTVAKERATVVAAAVAQVPSAAVAAPKFCAACGAALSPAWRFCKSCGAKIEPLP